MPSPFLRPPPHQSSLCVHSPTAICALPSARSQRAADVHLVVTGGVSALAGAAAPVDQLSDGSWQGEFGAEQAAKSKVNLHLLNSLSNRCQRLPASYTCFMCCRCLHQGHFQRKVHPHARILYQGSLNPLFNAGLWGGDGVGSSHCSELLTGSLCMKKGNRIAQGEDWLSRSSIHQCRLLSYLCFWSDKPKWS